MTEANVARPTTILIATNNPHKAAEVRAMLHGLDALGVRFAAPADFPGIEPPVEDADTFDGNARIKAVHYARHAGCWALADDSGLEVDALGGAPGVRSARYADRPGDDAANNRKLIAELAGVPPDRRTARFRCVVALAAGPDILATATGVVHGVIVDEPAGNNGFGYDPHFFVPDCGMTAAQMSPDRKNRISHRGRAIRAMLPTLERLLAGR
ncbi:MAG: RdgB/HAM1 family non-canonical purine NTP pyrophosphatase [Phycisphaerae bacterium]